MYYVRTTLSCWGEASYTNETATYPRYHRRERTDYSSSSIPSVEANFEAIWETGKQNWFDVLLSVVVFALFAALVNTGIAMVAENPSILAFVKRLGVGIADELSQTTLAFFFKNVTIIPLTIVWMYHGLYGYFVRDRRNQ